MYQEEDHFRLEAQCDGNVIFAENYQRVDNASAEQQTNLTVVKDDLGQFTNTDEACVGIIRAVTSYYDESLNSPMKYIVAENSGFAVEIQQPSGSILIDFVGGKLLFNTRKSFNRYRFPDDEESFTFTAPNYPELETAFVGGELNLSYYKDDIFDLELELLFSVDGQEPSVVELEGPIAKFY